MTRSSRADETGGATSGDGDPGENRDLPRVAVLYDQRSVDVFRFADAARNTWRTTWLVDEDREPLGDLRRLLARFGSIVDMAGLSGSSVAEAIGEPVDGLVVLNEARLAEAADLAPLLGVPFLTPTAVVNLTDKYAQREAFRGAGIPTPASVLIPAGSLPDEVASAVVGLTFPAIVKPAHGRSSRSTTGVSGPDEVVQFLAAMGARTTEDFVAEERIPDSWLPGERPWADYVSVESFLSAGRFAHFSVTGRTPIASDFRETGMVLPSNLPRSQWASLTKLAEEAIRSLDAHIGVFHTEIKLAPMGPRVIEVNGRLGAGGLTLLAERVASRSLLNDVGRVALGMPVVFDEDPFDGVGFFWLDQPPADARSVAAITGLEEIRALPGVDVVTVARAPGEALNPREEGSLTSPVVVIGVAADHDALWSLLDRIRATLVVDYAT